ncbi:hypothetical protein HDU67_002387 [Dinochytrium kinnereticum]|nr:hypothetical protein HDU67_002387 [Dinochytrium kinnereticum]
MDVDEDPPTDFFQPAPDIMALDDPDVDLVEPGDFGDDGGAGAAGGEKEEGGGDGGGGVDEEEEGEGKGRGELFAPSVREIEGAGITALAEENWKVPPKVTQKNQKALNELALRIWREEIVGSGFDLRRVMMLEFSRYLENFLLPLYTPTKSPEELLLSIVQMINEKFRHGLDNVWDHLTTDDGRFSHLFREILGLMVRRAESTVMDEQTVVVLRSLVTFLVNAFRCVERREIRRELLGVVGVFSWGCLVERRREVEISGAVELRKAWNRAEKKFEGADAATKERMTFDRTFISTLIKSYLRILNSITDPQKQTSHVLLCERFLELLIDLESQIPSRRYIHTLIDDHMVVPLSHRSALHSTLIDQAKMNRARPRFKPFAFVKMLERLEFYLNFQIDNVTGQALSESEYLQAHYTRMQRLQRLCFSRFREEMEDLALASPSSVDSLENLKQTFVGISSETLSGLCEALGLRTTGLEGGVGFQREYLAEILAHRFSRRTSYLNQVASLPVYPNEEDLFEDTSIPPLESFSNDHCLPVPKLNLQYLTVLDYLQRNFSLYRLETASSIRQDIEDVREGFRTRFGVKAVRGCEVIDLAGEDGESALNGRGGEGRAVLRGQRRTLRVAMDVDQYLDDAGKTQGTPYGAFNVLVRRKSRENNFKAVLETMRDLMQSDLVVPEWFGDTFLGYGDPVEAVFVEAGEEGVRKVDLGDTFLDLEHVREVFAGLPLSVETKHDGARPLFSLALPEETARSFVLEGADSDVAMDGNKVEVTSYSPPYAGPLKDLTRRQNEVKFTQAQVRAITSACLPGLTLVSGPPGTGKTDVAVQIISNLYHSHPDQNILLITHSNHALNQLFEKIMALDIDPRHLLRLGHGFEDIDSESNWGKYGRVQSFLDQRAYLLAEVDKLAYSLGVQGAFGNSCETASYFFAFHVKSFWEPYVSEYILGDGHSPADIASRFPFHFYFHEAPQPLFPVDASLEEVKKIAKGCYGHIQGIFQQIEEIRAFELLRNNHDRSNYLLVKEAKIIALTCTYAALKRRELISLGFRYDTVIMEEAAQILEVEAFIPLVLQSASPQTGESTLERVVLIGDQNQLPPIVKNVAISRYGNLEQSLFTRLLRLGVPAVGLDRQGRARESICDLYRWRYEGLKDLVGGDDEGVFKAANPGFAFEYQMINVENFNGKGETEPVPYFYQNLGEAEYVVATYQYMRLLGYPAHKISILTTYNGQKALIEDVLDRRCKRNPMFGLPARVSTVDKYQGQQNDYILLSLVRTKTVGHIRDVRRLVVALSRARLGLYVFCRRRLFENCFELTPAVSQLVARPTDQLWLRGKEEWSEEGVGREVGDTGVVVGKGMGGRWEAEAGKVVFRIDDVVHMGKYVFNMIQEQVNWIRKRKEESAAAAASSVAADSGNAEVSNASGEEE